MFFKVENSTIAFGGLVANSDINVEAEEGQIVGLIGPNGAGKSTLFKSISGFNKIDSGKIYFNGHDITRRSPNHICNRGIACTFQNAQSFVGMTLEESVMVGAYLRRRHKNQALTYAHEMIDFVGLAGKEDTFVHRLNMFERKKTELASALATEPKMILLDELFAGLVSTEVAMMVQIIKKVNAEKKIALFIVEHVLRVIMELCEKVYVMEYGKMIASGTPQQVSSDDNVIKAYLGADYDVAQDK
ncbi:MAG: ABC transporter ATP-binding protein [Treponema sp.]|nr:ABC transporter ATP-binding protein [Treponema sp.]